MAAKLEGSAETLYLLKTYDKQLYRELGKKLESDLRPIMGPIQGQINGSVTSALKSRRDIGMFHDGRSGWSGVEVKTKTSIQPKNLIFIEGKGRNLGLDTQVGFEYAELAGIRRRPPRAVSKGWGSTGVGYHSYIQNGQGDGFIDMLGRYGKPGRFLWKRVLNRKPQIEKKVSDIAETFNIRVNRKLS